MTMKPFGKQLRELREAAGLSQAALGKALGIHPVCVSQYEAAVNVPRAERMAAILAYFEKAGSDVAPAADPPAKKRGRPRKVTPEPEAVTAADKSKPTRRRAKWGRPKKVAELIEQKVIVSVEDADPVGAPPSKVHSQARLGQVSLAWVEQQVASYVHARGTSFADGQACVVVLRRRDVIELGKALLEACGMKIGEE